MRILRKRPELSDYMEIRDVWATDIPTLCTHLRFSGPWIVEVGIVVVVGIAIKPHPVRQNGLIIATLVSAGSHNS